MRHVLGRVQEVRTTRQQSGNQESEPLTLPFPLPVNDDNGTKIWRIESRAGPVLWFISVSPRVSPGCRSPPIAYEETEADGGEVIGRSAP